MSHTRQFATATLRTFPTRTGPPTRTMPPRLARPLSGAATRVEKQQAESSDDMKPWSNEFSVSGTTWEMCMHTTTRNGTVDPEMEMREVEIEVQDEIREAPTILTWSAANSQISSWCASEREAGATAIACPGEPWIARHQPPRPELQRGLFKPVHKPPKKHLE